VTGLGLRAFIAYQLRKYADRIDNPGAPKAMSVRFTFEDRVGIVFRDDGRGCRLWYLGDVDYERAHTEAGPVTGARSTAWLPQRNAAVVPLSASSFAFEFGRPQPTIAELTERHARELGIREAERLAAIQAAYETGEQR
jgi:hypothetical protein